MSERKAPTGTITGTEAMDTTWQTPPHLVAMVRAYFGGTIPFDAATADDNPCGAEAFATEHLAPRCVCGNALIERWPERTWVNPPYGRALRGWLGKMESEAIEGREIVALLPAARFEQRYFQTALGQANALCFIRKRVNFIRPSTGDAVGGNPYANLFVGWNVDPRRFRDAFGAAGSCWAMRSLCGPPCKPKIENTLCLLCGGREAA